MTELNIEFIKQEEEFDEWLASIIATRARAKKDLEILPLNMSRLIQAVKDRVDPEIQKGC